jgi:hypothetical protein
MKIKTITCHEVYNHGASLQEYALLYYLNQQGHQAEVIHYKPNYLSGQFNLWSVSNSKFNKILIKQLYIIAKLPNRIVSLKRKKAFDQFHAKYIPTGKVKYTSNKELKLHLPDADAYICGSDQIWNSFFQNGKDPAFYLNFVPHDKIKLSYAASFAIDQLEESIKPLVKVNVSRLNAIGVRETSGLQILKELGIANAVQVLDPVFLLEIEHWNQFISPINEEFVFVYDFDSNPTIKQIALHLKQEKGWKIYTVNSNIKYADKNFHLEGPEKFLSLVAHSKFNLSNSFHSAAFSILFGKQFIVVNRVEKINTRMCDLLNLFGLENNLIDNSHRQLPIINYEEIKINLKRLKLKSQEFLTQALSIENMKPPLNRNLS